MKLEGAEVGDVVFRFSLTFAWSLPGGFIFRWCLSQFAVNRRLCCKRRLTRTFDFGGELSDCVRFYASSIRVQARLLHSPPRPPWG
jgi:hypothetical protein